MKKQFMKIIGAGFLIIFVFILISLLALEPSNIDIDYTSAQNGYLDLSEYDFQRYIHSLNGEWSFNYLDLKNSSLGEFAKLPGSFSQNPNYSPQGYGEYMLKLKLNPNYELYSFKFMDMPSAYSFSINNSELISSGLIGNDKSSEFAQIKHQTIIYKPSSDVLYLSLKISNFHHFKGGAWTPILIGIPENIQNISKHELFKSSILLGIFCFIFFWNLSMSFLQNQSQLYFKLATTSLFCIFKLALTSSFILSAFSLDFSFEMQFKLEYFFSVLIILIIFEIIFSYFENIIPRELFLFARITLISYLFIILIFPFEIYGKVLLMIGASMILLSIIICYFIIIEIKYKKHYAIVLFGILTSCTMICIELLYTKGLIVFNEYSNLFSLGILVFLLCFSHSLNLDISKAFEGAKEQTNFKISLLQSQIAPHFLHNSINTAIYMIDTEPEQAKDLLIDFSNYLRAKFRSETQNLDKVVSIKQELDVVHSYIALQRARFGNKINVNYDIDPNSYFLRVPPLLLQPLVENAIEHGNINNNIFLSISIKHSNSGVVISIQDNGPGISKTNVKKLLSGKLVESQSQKRVGLGLYATHHRLEMLYGRGLVITSSKSTGTRIDIQIPITSKRGIENGKNIHNRR
jgi:sensor histidine kinase YesM